MISRLVCGSVPILILFFAFCTLLGCSPSQEGKQRLSPFAMREPLQTSTAPKPELRKLRKIVVAPVFITPTASAARLHQARFQSRIQEYASGRLGVESISGLEVQRKARDIYGARRFNHEERLDLMAAFGADAVLETVVLNFRERQGSSVGSSHPAEVGIRYKLYRSAREPIWEASYHFKDKALSEDLLSVRNRFSGNEGIGLERGGWKGAYNLLEDSIEKALGDLESQRAKSFSSQR